MRVIPLTAVPNQSFTLTIDGVRWVLGIKEAKRVMVCDVSRDGELILSGSRVLAGETLIPYEYLQSGNFIFITGGDELPDWTRFNASQTLVYLSEAELADFSNLTIGEILALTNRVEYLFTDDGFYITTDVGDLIEDA